MHASVKETDPTRVIINVLRSMDREIGSALETLEISCDDEALESIENGLKDIKSGRVISFSEFKKKHGLK
ncbi:hypothetical protein [Candidatus Pyrohabitans sp.]